MDVEIQTRRHEGPPQTVYVVTEGSYSDYHIEAVFSTGELADLYVENHGGGVEEYDLNPDFVVYPRDRTPYYVCLTKDGAITWVTTQSWDRFLTLKSLVYLRDWGDELAMETYCVARDRQHAMKIAAERWQFFAAQDELWPTARHRARRFRLEGRNWIEVKDD